MADIEKIEAVEHEDGRSARVRITLSDGSSYKGVFYAENTGASVDLPPRPDTFWRDWILSLVASAALWLYIDERPLASVGHLVAAGALLIVGFWAIVLPIGKVLFALIK